MLARGATFRQLADHFGLSYATIQNDVKEIEKRWLKRSTEKAEVWKGRIIAEKDAVIQEAWAAWQRSKTNPETADDPRFLTIINSASDSKAKIIGIEAPTKMQHSGPNGEILPIVAIEVVRTVTAEGEHE